MAQHPRDPPDHMEDRGIHGNQCAAGAAAGHLGQDVPDQVQGPLPPQVSAAETACDKCEAKVLGWNREEIETSSWNVLGYLGAREP